MINLFTRSLNVIFIINFYLYFSSILEPFFQTFSIFYKFSTNFLLFYNNKLIYDL